MNNLVSFMLEESMYRTRIANPSLLQSATFPKYEGYPARQWHDIRSEFGPVSLSSTSWNVVLGRVPARLCPSET